MMGREPIRVKVQGRLPMRCWGKPDIVEVRDDVEPRAEEALVTAHQRPDGAFVVAITGDERAIVGAFGRDLQEQVHRLMMAWRRPAEAHEQANAVNATSDEEIALELATWLRWRARTAMSREAERHNAHASWLEGLADRARAYREAAEKPAYVVVGELTEKERKLLRETSPQLDGELVCRGCGSAWGMRHSETCHNAAHPPRATTNEANPEGPQG